MGLSRIEKCAGRWFRGEAEKLLAASLIDFPDSAPCSPHVYRYRHPCPEVAGRTRSIALQDVIVSSPEIWVSWNGDDVQVITRGEAEALVAAGTAVEFETVLAGKFEFTWKNGRCDKCGLRAISREGEFSDARPVHGMQQEDLATFTQGMQTRVTGGVRREHT